MIILASFPSSIKASLPTWFSTTFMATVLLVELVFPLEAGARKFDGGVEFLLEQFAGRQSGEVVGDVDAGLAEFEEFDLFGLFPCAENDSKGRLFLRLLLVFGEPAEVKFHLAFVFCLEVAELEVDGNETPEAAVIEEEIEVEVVRIDLDAFLAGEEGKAVAEFKKE